MSYDDTYGKATKTKKPKGAETVSRLAGLGGTKKAGARADWGDVHPDNIVWLLLAVTRLGGAASFGLSRDRAVFNISVFMDGEKHTEWCETSELCDEKLKTLAEYFDSLPR